MIIGATPAGIAVAGTLGEMGIPVTLVDTEPDLDKKLSKEEWKLDSGLSLNYAYRSDLIRILRNPDIDLIIPANVKSLRHTPQGFRAKIRRYQTFVDSQKCILCGHCFENCPVTTVEGNKPLKYLGRSSLPGRPVIDKKRQPLCQTNCPLGVNVQGYIALSKAGKYQEALELVRKNNILPGICGRICTHPCEDACRRGELDEPLAIRDIKRFLADYELSNNCDAKIPMIEQRPEKIAIIGSGPSGLAAAADLARLGYQVTIFEKEAEAGGLLRYGIGPHRLPREILDKELEQIQKLGVRIKTSHMVDMTSGLQDLEKDFHRVILAIGAWVDRMPGVEGEDLDYVDGCISFLSQLYRCPEEERGSIVKKGEKIAIIGDGPSAFDLARVLKRLGANVTILSWFPEDIIPAGKHEISEARDEGIEVLDRIQVIKYTGPNGRLKSLRCKPTEPGEPDDMGIPWPVVVSGSEAFELKFDRAIIAIGQLGPFMREGSISGITTSAGGYISIDDHMHTDSKAFYAVGDVTTGPLSVVEEMASGRSAAGSIHRDITGEDVLSNRTLRPEDMEFSEIPADLPSLARPVMAEKQPASRVDNFSEVALGLSEIQVRTEVERCLQCGACSECFVCVEACSAINAVNHSEQAKEIVEQAGAVIIADPKAAPPIKGEDVIRAYGPKSARSTPHDMLAYGFAAAAIAMNFMGGSPIRPKGLSVSFSPPEQELSPEIRTGVFVCKCNSSHGWSDDMDRFVEGLHERDNIIHAEAINSACIPEGSAAILKTIREKGITRMVLASCVCCPLDFICSACTDQRSRLKDALFKETGISRSMVETTNLRGEALSYLKYDAPEAIRRFKGLIERAIARCVKLQQMPSPVRSYNFSTAVVGDSEAEVNSACMLAEAGFEVYVFRSLDKPMPDMLSHPNIYCFEKSLIKGISGTLGDFQVFVESDDLPNIFQVGAIILGEKSRRTIPYINEEGLPDTTIDSPIQKLGHSGVPFLYPGTTSISGLFLASPQGVRISERKKGAAAAVLAASVMPRGPRSSKGYMVGIRKDMCRGCGRCVRACPYHAITLQNNSVGGWYAQEDEALCKGCGNCISVCPSNAADSPYRDRFYLEQLIQEVLA
jgi:NADPH-dependent glutamate synthase beta subunit-like oxidoreductase/Pyruvate/2-oxoacid:ferredoxin oxidoreductase delta subunit